MNQTALATAFAICSISAVAAQQTEVTFEVASVKPQTRAFPTEFGEVMTAAPRARPGGVYAGTHATLASLIMFAHNLEPSEVIGGPDWIHREYFEVNAKAASGAGVDQLRLMVQALLKERFQLLAHNEQRDTEAFALVLARADGRTGPYLQRADGDCGRQSVEIRKKFPTRVATTATARRLSGTCMPIRGLVGMVSMELRMPVLDKTGLDGTWVFDALFAGEPSFNAATANTFIGSSDPALPPFALALEEQFGLKLERTRGTIAVLVIDSVRRPTEN